MAKRSFKAEVEQMVTQQAFINILREVRYEDLCPHPMTEAEREIRTGIALANAYGDYDTEQELETLLEQQRVRDVAKWMSETKKG